MKIQKLGDDDALTISLVENLQRNDLEPRETIETLATLLKRYSLRDIAKKIGKGFSYVQDMAGTVQLLHTLQEHNIKVSNQPKDLIIKITGPFQVQA